MTVITRGLGTARCYNGH